MPHKINTPPFYLNTADETKEWLDETVASVEIVNSVGELERVHFRYPSFCKLLSRSAKDSVLWGVDRETPGKQAVEFVTIWAPQLHREMMHLEKLERMKLWKALRWFRRFGVVEFMFGLAIAQNVLLVLAFSSLKFEVGPERFRCQF